MRSLEIFLACLATCCIIQKILISSGLRDVQCVLFLHSNDPRRRFLINELINLIQLQCHFLASELRFLFTHIQLFLEISDELLQLHFLSDQALGPIVILATAHLRAGFAQIDRVLMRKVFAFKKEVLVLCALSLV